MGRVYTIPINGNSSAIVDAWELNSASGNPLLLHQVRIEQSSTTSSQQIPVTIFRNSTTSGSGGASPPARPVNPGDAAFSGTVETLNTSLASTASAIDLVTGGFNTLSGYDYLPTPECREASSAGGRLVVRLGAPSSQITYQGFAKVEELA